MSYPPSPIHLQHALVTCPFLEKAQQSLGRRPSRAGRHVHTSELYSPHTHWHPAALPEFTRTITDIEYTWRKRKPTHLPPLLKLSPFSSSFDGPDSPTSLITPMSTYHRRGSVLSVAPSIISNAPSTASASSTSDAPSDSTQRRTKLERLRRKLRAEVPTTAVFPTTPRTAHPHAQDLHLHFDAQALTLRTHTHHRPSSRPSRRHTHPRVLDQLRREHTYGRAVRAYAPPALPAQDKSTSSDPAKRWPQVPRSPLTDR